MSKIDKFNHTHDTFKNKISEVQIDPLGLITNLNVNGSLNLNAEQQAFCSCCSPEILDYIMYKKDIG